jgi:hypothetical protein
VQIKLKSHDLRLNKCPCFYRFTVRWLGVDLFLIQVFTTVKFRIPCSLVDVTGVSGAYSSSIFMLDCD